MTASSCDCEHRHQAPALRWVRMIASAIIGLVLRLVWDWLQS
jgi:hypothetical protein